MSRILRLGVAITVALLIVLMTASVALAATAGYTGTWESIDPWGDESYLWLDVGAVGPQGQAKVVYCDTGASVFGVDPVTGIPLYAALGKSTMRPADTGLFGTFRMFRVGSRNESIVLDFGLQYSAETDTMIDNMGGVWFRRVVAGTN